MDMTKLRPATFETKRHRTAYLEAGPADGPLMIFVHGYPKLGVVWRHQMEYFAAAGWRCIAPDMRGAGGSSVPTRTSDYAVRHGVTDMLELHDALGGEPAIWVGHDWGSLPVWMMAAHHPERCRGVIVMCVPYFARGLTHANLVAGVNRDVYPADKFPYGQWDYQLYHREHAGAAAAQLDADVEASISMIYRRSSPDTVGKPSIFASVRERGGFFGSGPSVPKVPRDETMLSDEDFATFVEAYTRTGFRGVNCYYLNEADNAAYALEAPNFGELTLPVLFIHARRDSACDTVYSRLADPMREDCHDLAEATVDAGHTLMIEEPAATNAAMDEWLTARHMNPPT